MRSFRSAFGTQKPVRHGSETEMRAWDRCESPLCSLFHPECASYLDSHIPVLVRESGRAWGIPIHSLTNPIVVDWIMARSVLASSQRLRSAARLWLGRLETKPGGSRVFRNTRMNGYIGAADGFHVNVHLITQMELPNNRDTVLHFFEQMRKGVPGFKALLQARERGSCAGEREGTGISSVAGDSGTPIVLGALQSGNDG